MPRYKHIQSVSRALDTLQLVANSADGLKVHQVANGLGVSKQTAHNLLRTLVHKGFLEKYPSPPRYRLGSALETMRRQHAWWNREFLMRSIPYLIRASRDLSATAFLGQHVGGKAIIRFVAPADQSVTPHTLYGSPMAPYGSALVLQAFLSREDLLDFRGRHPLEKYDPGYWKSYENIDQLLDVVRREGYLCLVKTGVFRAAAPIRDESGAVRAAMALSKPFDKMDPGEPVCCVSKLLEATRQISRNMTSTAGKNAVYWSVDGHAPPPPGDW